MIAASDHGYPTNSLFVTLGNRSFGKGTFTTRTLGSNYTCTVMSRTRCTPRGGERVVLISGYLRALRRLTGCRHHRLNAGIVNVAKAGKGAAAGRLVSTILSGSRGMLCARKGLGGRVKIPVALLHLGTRRRLTIVRVKTGRPKRVGFLMRVTRPSCKVVAGIKGTRLRKFNSFRKIVHAGKRLCSCLHRGRSSAIFVRRSGTCLVSVTRNLGLVPCKDRSSLCMGKRIAKGSPCLAFR